MPSPTLKRDISLIAIGLLRAASTLSSSWRWSTRASVPRRNRRVGTGELTREAVTLGAGRRPAPSDLRQAGGQVLPFAIERLIGGLQRGVGGDDLLEFMDPAGMLLSERPLFGDFSLEPGRPPPVATEFLLGLFEQLLVALQHAALLSMGLEQLGEIQA
jgi:hypothetical protein